MTDVVADTHAIVWYILGLEKLSQAALDAMDRATDSGDLIYVSAISIVEIRYLIDRERIPEAVLAQIAANLDAPDQAIAIAPVDWSIATAIQQIDRLTVPEMPDRIIAATALSLNRPLVTRDRKIQALTTIQTIW